MWRGQTPPSTIRRTIMNKNLLVLALAEVVTATEVAPGMQGLQPFK